MRHDELLTSLKNPKVKYAVSLRERRERDSRGVTILEGYRELFRANAIGLPFHEVFYCPELFLGENEEALLDSLASRGASLYRCSEVVLRKLAYRDRPEGLIAVIEVRRKTLADIPKVPNGLYLVAETIEKPGNLGSMLRSADAVGATAMIVCNKQTDFYNPNVIRASTGAIFSVPLAEATSEECLAWLRSFGIRTLAATPHTTRNFTDADMAHGVAVVVGAEQFGLTPFWMDSADEKVVIPMLGLMDSLNVATAATILLYEAARQRGWKASSAVDYHLDQFPGGDTGLALR